MLTSTTPFNDAVEIEFAKATDITMNLKVSVLSGEYAIYEKIGNKWIKETGGRGKNGQIIAIDEIKYDTPSGMYSAQVGNKLKNTRNSRRHLY